MSKVLITGGAGFIGSNLTESLITNNEIVVIDDFNEYYDPKIKQRNIAEFTDKKQFALYQDDIRDTVRMQEIFAYEKPDIVIHLAARGGTRRSISEKGVYESVNITGTKNILDACLKSNITQIIFASSSSVYGTLAQIPFKEAEKNLQQNNPYGKTKYLAEQMCHEYERTYNLPITIFRFFTVYGPKGRPDMAPYLFTRAILTDQPIIQYGEGDSERDYTYISDIVEGICLGVTKKIVHEVINLGNSHPVKLSQLIRLIEMKSGKTALIEKRPRNEFEMQRTYADITKAKDLLGWSPRVSIEEGIGRFVDWMVKNV